MSRCAQGTPPANGCRNSAAVIAPGLAPALCASATSESIRLAYSSSSGSRHRLSPAACPAAISPAASSSSVANSPAVRRPSAVRTEPVSVAMSTNRSGRSRAAAYASASASTTRPSASVLRTSVVRPPYCRITSLGRYAEPDTAFSAAGTSAVTRSGGQRAQHRGAPRHVGLHQAHRLRRLDAQPAGVEGDALADHHHPGAGGAARRPARLDQPWPAGGAAADREDAVEAL